MSKLIALYKRPEDKATFDDHHFVRHVSLAKTLPGLQLHHIGDGRVAGPGGTPYHLVAAMTVGSLAEIQQLLASAKGRRWPATWPISSMAASNC